MTFKKRASLPPAHIEIIPMIDVMLFLLVFFMLSSLALTKLNGLPVQLPKAKSADKVGATASPATLTVRQDGSLFLNRQPVKLEQLPQALRNTAEPLLINADERVPHGLVVHCMDAARRAGITRFSIAATP